MRQQKFEIAPIEYNFICTKISQALVAPDFSANDAAREIKFLPSGDGSARRRHRNRPVQLVRIQPGNRTSFGFEFVPLRETKN
jgi:branched-chain amino acid transport system substrate-binding protein